MKKSNITAALSEWIYQSDFSERCIEIGLDVVHISEGKFKWAVVRSSSCVFVVFRGTNNMSNWLSNLKAFPTYTRTFGWAHRGWKGLFRGLEGELNTVLNSIKHPNIYVVFCGHSLGGAVAQFAAVWYRKKHKPLKCETVSFGSPKPGLKSFSDRMKLIPYTRYFNDDDPATKAPGYIIYRHPHCNDIEVTDGEDGFLDVGEHNMKLYRELALNAT